MVVLKSILRIFLIVGGVALLFIGIAAQGGLLPIMLGALLVILAAIAR